MPEQRDHPLKDMVSETRYNKLVRAVTHRQRGLMLVMEDVYNPYNLAAIARSCDAFGVQNIAVIFENQEFFNPREAGKESAVSANKWLDYRLFNHGTADALATLKAEGWHLVATALTPDAQPIQSVDLTHDKLALIVGNEHAGVSRTTLETVDTVMTIPMVGMVESFNVSVASAISLYEITRQRQASGRDFYLSDEKADALLTDFIAVR